MSQPTTGILLNSTDPPAPAENQNIVPQSDGSVPLQSITFYPQAATETLLGVVKPDGVTTSVAADGTFSAIASGDPSIIQAIQQQQYVFGVDTGIANAYLVQLTPPPAITQGSLAIFLAANENTGPSTLSIEGSPIVITAPITKQGTLALTGGEIGPGQIIVCIYDGTNFQIVSAGPPGTGGGGSGGGGTTLPDVIPSGTIDGLNVTFTVPTDGSPGPGGGVGSPSTLRGSALQTGTGSASVTVSLPPGSTVGDLAILFVSAAYSITLPSGWTSLYSYLVSTWNVLACSKILTGGDISTGSVTITASNTFDMAAGLAVFVGATGGVRETEGQVTSGSPVTMTNTTTSAVLSSDTAIYWASDREAAPPGPTLPVITPASGAAAELADASTTNAWSILAYQQMPGGSLAVANYIPSPGGGIGDHAVQVIVQTTGGAGPGAGGGALGNLYKNGVLQNPLGPTPDYTIVGTTITMANAPVSTPRPDWLLWVYR